ncbi:transporter [Paraburkholderia sp. J63]|uniref:SphA family protein n=1 Tax=Paraburkholderia sp. J63 TaxID=2805434 RepID=UPI002ABDEAF3|nr:transporter [Paraburkholderia sp. J63]
MALVAIGVGSAPASHATEGALGRPVAGTSVLTGVGEVPPAGIYVVNLEEIYLDGSISGSREVPIGGKASTGIDAQVSLTLASIIRGWGSIGGWSFASGITVPYIWTEVTGTTGIGRLSSSTSDRASNIYDLYFTPVEAGYSFSQNSHLALSFNFWAPTGQYNANDLANASLNTWTFVPQVAYTQLVPSYGLEFDVVAALQFYTRNNATNYQNGPLFTLDAMGLKRFANGVGIGVVMGTVQQLANDTGPLADRLNGFRGHDFTLGPIITYDTKIGGKAPFSASLRWVPTIASTNRLKGTTSVMATATLAF